MATPVELAKLTEVGQLQYSGGRYREALQVCEKIYELDAYRPDNLLMLGGIHFQLRNFSESIFYLQQCVRIEPTFAEAYSNLGNAIKELGDLAGAVQFYLKAIKLKPRFFDAYNNLALTYTQQGDVAQALQTYQMALVLQPNLVEAHCNLGNLHKSQGNLESARRSYLEAIRIQPGFAIAWSNLAGVFKEEGQLSTAMAYYREAIRLAPHFADAYSNLGNALKEQGSTDEAMSCYKAAIAIRPDFAIAHGNLGSCYYDKGMLAEAIKTFKHAVQLNPNFPDCFNNLGNALRDYKGGGQRGAKAESDSFEEAVYSYRTALKLKPEHPHAYNNLGNAMKEKGLVREAMHCFVTAARLMPKFAAAHSNIGCLLLEAGKLSQGLAHFHEAVQLDPGFAEGFSNMGVCYRKLGRAADAVKCFVAAIQLQPHFADAYANLGACYLDSSEVKVAVECYRRALTHSNNSSAAAEAGLCWAQLLLCEDWEGLASRLEGLAELTREELSLSHHYDYDPPPPLLPHPSATGSETSASGGGACGGGSGAASSKSAAVPVAALHGLAVAAPRRGTFFGGNLEGGGSGGRVARSQLVLPLPSVQPFQAAAYGSQFGFGAELQRDLARRYATRAVANATAMSELAASSGTASAAPQASTATTASTATMATTTATTKQRHYRPRKRGQRLHVGYVSSDFGDHPVGHLVEALLKCHDKAKVLVTCYATSPHDLSPIRRSIEATGRAPSCCCERFQDLSGLSDADAASAISSDSVHVLIDLNGYSKGARTEIFALRPCPLQVLLPFGYCGTMGSAFTDYLVGDAALVPPPPLREDNGAESDASSLWSDGGTSDATGFDKATSTNGQAFVDEKVAYLPHSFCVGAHRESSRFVLDSNDPLAPTRALYGLPEDKFVFCNFSQLRKISPQVLDVWCAILKRVPNSLLWLLRFSSSTSSSEGGAEGAGNEGAGNEDAEKNLRREAWKRGVKSDQLVFSDTCPRDEHLRRGKLAELFLDTPFCGNAHTTALDCLWAGTPVLTVKGDAMASRVGESLLKAAGLEKELCCAGLAEYEELAVELAMNDDHYMRLRTKLEMGREVMPLFDNKRWMANAEAAFEMMWERHECGLRPDHLMVPDVVGKPTLSSAGIDGE